MHEYGTDFYRFLASFAVRSAQRVVPRLTAAIPCDLNTDLSFLVIPENYARVILRQRAADLCAGKAHQWGPVHEYGTDFYRFLASFAVRSAEQIAPKLTAAIPVCNVVDFGCGQGAWLSVWAAAGATVVGVDGPYIDRRGLLIDPGDFHPADLSAPIDPCRLPRQGRARTGISGR